MTWLKAVLLKKRKEALQDLSVLRWNLSACIAFEWYEDAHKLREKIVETRKRLGKINQEIRERSS